MHMLFAKTRFHAHFPVLVMCSAFAFGACAEDGKTSTEAAPNIVLGADGVGVDAADAGCRVVLRSVARVSNGRGGFETDCSSGSCRWVWEGHVDVAAGLVGTPAVLFKTQLTNDRWVSVDAVVAVVANTVATEGFSAWTFRIAEGTPAEGESGTALSRARIDLIPYLRTTDGGRLFDHNRVADSFGTYALTADSGFAVSDDGTTCRASSAWPTWRFSFDFAERLDDGPVIAGGSVRVAYDGRRLRDHQSCLGAHGSVQATTLSASWRFDNGVEGTAEVERWVSNAGIVTATVSEPLVPVPVGARSLEMWFSCVPGFDGAPNVRYDSDDGRNYRVPVIVGARSIDWAGHWVMFRGRAGDSVALPEPIAYHGFSNMALAPQLSVYVEGLTDQPVVDAALLRAWVESDAISCTPGGMPTREELPLWKTHQGAYGNDALFQWRFESNLGRCPRGEYRYRFVLSADGGLTTTTLGNAASSDDAGSDGFRTIRYD